MVTHEAKASSKGEYEMYKTQIEKFAVGENISTSVMIEKEAQGAHYALLRISMLGKNSFAICILGDGYAFETVGENAKESKRLFDLIVKESASPTHLFDIVSDFRREREAV